MEKFNIQSNSAGIASVENYISMLCGEKNVYNHFATISMAVLQAVENAVVHGNNNDPSKMVSIECGEFLGGVYFEIEDQGNGFDFTKYGNLPAVGGKGDGIFMMKLLADKIEYSKQGRCVRMEFLIKGIDAADAMKRRSTLAKFHALGSVNV